MPLPSDSSYRVIITQIILLVKERSNSDASEAYAAGAVASGLQNTILPRRGLRHAGRSYLRQN